MAYQSIIFDLDGTLLNTIEDIKDACNIILTKHGFPEKSEDQYRHLVGKGVKKLISDVIPQKYSKDSRIINELTMEMEELYSEYTHRKTKPYNGIPEMLNECLCRNMSLSILSNKPQKTVRESVNYFFKDIPFHTVRGSNPDFKRKPDPGQVFDIIQTCGIPKNETIFIGDTGIDMQTAKNAGLYAIGALWGFRDREELEKAGADHLISGPMDLFNLSFHFSIRLSE